MKKILPFLFVVMAAISCNNSNTSANGADTANTTSPSVIKDTGIQHPNGVTSDGVISTDTSGFGVKAAKPDSAPKKK